MESKHTFFYIFIIIYAVILLLITIILTYSGTNIYDAIAYSNNTNDIDVIEKDISNFLMTKTKGYIVTSISDKSTSMQITKLKYDYVLNQIVYDDNVISLDSNKMTTLLFPSMLNK